MSEAVLIQVPYELGREDVGLGRGVPVLSDALASGRAVVSVVREQEFRNEIAASMDVVRTLAQHVARVVANGRFPIVLAGNCNSSLGTVAGLGEDVGVVWFDAHADFNTPETSASGFLDGMALAILTGSGWAALRQSIEGLHPVPEDHVVLVGARDLDNAEQERLAASGVRRAGVDDLEGVLDALRERTEAVYLHVDLDVLDPSAGRANPFATDGGLDVDQLAAAVDAVSRHFAVRAMAFTAYQPDCDPDGAIPEAARSILAHVPAAAGEGVRA